jgi:hypothetical protein
MLYKEQHRLLYNRDPGTPDYVMESIRANVHAYMFEEPPFRRPYDNPPNSETIEHLFDVIGPEPCPPPREPAIWYALVSMRECAAEVPSTRVAHSHISCVDESLSKRICCDIVSVVCRYGPVPKWKALQWKAMKESGSSQVRPLARS